MWQYFGQNQQSLYDLWLGFLRYYTEVFDANAFVIQMRRSEPLTKFEKLWCDKPLAIEDPFDLNHNLASGLSWRSKRYSVLLGLGLLCPNMGMMVGLVALAMGFRCVGHST